MKIIDHVKGNSSFLYYRDGNLYYKTDDTLLVFPIPINDLGNATVNSIEKSLLLMRYIRKYIESLKV